MVLPPAIAAGLLSGAIGLGLGYTAREKFSSCNPGALVPSAQLTTTPAKPESGFLITGAPRVPENLPSAAAALQWAGWPGFDNIRFREGYVASFNRQTRNPNWVCEHLCKENMNGEANRQKSENFQEDPADPPHLRSTLEAYKGSGFDRGHLVAAADVKFSQSAMDETFYLSNISPQVGAGFNRGYWERLERWCRNLVFKGEYSDVFVISGPIYLPRKESDGKFYMFHQVLGNPPAVHVPTHFFKVILALPSRSAQSTLTLSPSPTKTDPTNQALVPASSWGGPEKPIALGAFVLPNQVIDEGIDLKSFEVPMEVVERFSGLQFFQRLPRSSGKHVKPLCSTAKCQLPPPFQSKDKKIKEIK